MKDVRGRIARLERATTGAGVCACAGGEPVVTVIWGDDDGSPPPEPGPCPTCGRCGRPVRVIELVVTYGDGDPPTDLSDEELAMVATLGARGAAEVTDEELVRLSTGAGGPGQPQRPK